MPVPSPSISDAAESRLPACAWLIVGLLSVVACLNYLDRVMLTTMRDSVKAAIPMTDAQFGLLTSVFLWVYGVLSPFAGFLADRLSRTRVIIGSLFLWSVTTWLTSNAVTFDQLHVSEDVVGDKAPYLTENMAVQLQLFEGNAISIEIPQRATFEVTETEPVMKGQTASGSFKPAMLSNGVRTTVPTHIVTGTRIVVMTEDGAYVERAKDLAISVGWPEVFCGLAWSAARSALHAHEHA